jgi:putative transposase
MEARTVTCAAAPTPEQSEALKDVMRAYNAACNHVSALAWDRRIFGRVTLQRLAYREVRERFGLPAQLAIHAIRKVADAYRVSKTVQAHFRPLGSITYDRRVLRLLGVSKVSCATLSGRITVKLSIGGYQRDRLAGATLGESKLTYAPEKNRFSFVFSVKIDPPPVSEPAGFLGVDMGVRNVAVDSDGTRHTGGRVRGLRQRHRKLRRRLQAKGTRGARRLLRKRRRKEARFQRHENHVIAKQLVAAAKGTGRGIAVEELTHIRSRITARRSHRAELSAWAFHQLRFFLTYKCADAGLPLVAVDPRNTSRTCPACGCVDKRNRKSQARFRCIQCGCSGHADVFAACEIASRAACKPAALLGEGPRETGSVFRQGKAPSL